MGARALNGKSLRSRTCSSIGVLEELDSNGVPGPPRILAILSSALEKCIQKNEKGLKASSQKEVITIFHGSRVPALSIRQYIDRIFKYSNCSPSCFVVAYIYLERFLHQMDIHLTSLNAHRLLITSFMLACKFVEDECYNNAYYAKVGGITTAEINRLEMKLLASIDFKLHVDEETFNTYCSQLEEEAMEKCRIERTFRICGWGKSFTNKNGSNNTPTAAI
ncbi:hypothetical protein M9H77_27678 [Catharanthus roseus]|uniref:Uncharacterized protein n=1 Tax=Catharanthus roseus TaxID=4058 RepID=A0ACC0ADD8_CATRO|nr:hypothetical protein M9H77_27678 [Catharanthus roseus]